MITWVVVVVCVVGGKLGREEAFARRGGGGWGGDCTSLQALRGSGRTGARARWEGGEKVDGSGALGTVCHRREFG